MDQSGLDIAGDLPQRGIRSQALVRVIDGALSEAMVFAARRAIARLKDSRFRESYFTTFWLDDDAEPQNAVERAVRLLSRKARPRGCKGAEWWIGRSYTNDVPIEFHFDEDVRGSAGLRHPKLSSVFFFNRVRGGQLAVTDARPGKGPATRLQAVAPRRNRYAIFAGDLLHGVLDARGRTPDRKLPGPRGRLRVTLVVNFWAVRPSKVPAWSESKLYEALGGVRDRMPGGARDRVAGGGRDRVRASDYRARRGAR
jgi:hypothetical protein